MEISINYLSVFIAAVAQMVVGFLWYGPVFGKKWMELSGISPEKMKAGQSSGMGKSYAIMFIGSLLTSYILAHALIFAEAYLQVSGLSAGLMVGALNWLGFVAPVTVGAVLWEGKPWMLWVLNSGFYLFSLLVMGAILAW